MLSRFAMMTALAGLLAGAAQAVDRARQRQSLDVVSNGAGGYVCRDGSNGCIAAPALNTNTIGGKLPQDWKDWVFVPVTGTAATLAMDSSSLNNGLVVGMSG